MYNIATKEDIRRAVGNRIICGFSGTSLNAELKEILRDIQPLGLILFSRNVESPEQICELNAEIKSWQKDKPLILAIDQEGGRVARVRSPATEWPAARKLGTINDTLLTKKVGSALGHEMRALNFDLCFAPVLDVDTNPDNPVIGDRSFSSLPEIVAKHAVEFFKGMQDSGIAGCGKHFPGHGACTQDSHDEPGVSFEEPGDHLIPFKELLAKLPSIMVGHLEFPLVDESSRPASRSRTLMDILRKDRP